MSPRDRDVVTVAAPRRRTPRIVVAAVALVALLAGPSAASSAPARAWSSAPVVVGAALGGDRDGATSTAAAPAADPRPDRLATYARELRDTPFVVDPELDWQYDRAERRRIVRELEGARIPFFVAVLPSIPEDESGGDLERVLQRLQREVGRPGLYVAVDQRARMDLASVGVPLDLGIPFSVLFPERDERPYEEQERDPAPPPWSTTADRLGVMVQRAAVAERGTPNGVIDDVDELRPLAAEVQADQRAEDALAAVLFGGFLGLVAAATVLGIRGVVRGGRAAAAEDRARRAAAAKRRSGGRGRRRGRRG